MKLRLTKWVNKSFRHDGNVNPPKKLDAKSIWNNYHGKEQGLGCGVLANFLAQAFHAIGVKARMVLGLSSAPDDPDTHTVVIAYDHEYPEGIAFDPTTGTDYRDEYNKTLNLRQLREKLSRTEIVRVNPDIKFDYLTYMTKNVFRFHAYSCSFYHTISETDIHFIA